MSERTNQATAVNGFLYTRTVYAMLISKLKTSFEQRLASASSSLIATNQSRLISSPLERESSLVATPKGELRYKTSGALKFTKWLIVMTMSMRLNLQMVKETAELLIVQNSKCAPSLDPCYPECLTDETEHPFLDVVVWFQMTPQTKTKTSGLLLMPFLNLCHYRLQFQKDLRFVDLRDSTRDTTATLITNLGM